MTAQSLKSKPVAEAALNVGWGGFMLRRRPSRAPVQPACLLVAGIRGLRLTFIIKPAKPICIEPPQIA